MDQLTEIEELEMIYCDMHKDVYGVKARWIKFGTVEEGKLAVESLSRQLEEEIIRERKEQENAATEFEQRIKSVIESGAKDRETAMRWIHEAEDTGGDNEMLCHRLGLKYDYFKKTS